MSRIKSEEKSIVISMGRNICFSSGEFAVSCASGIIWATWPCSGDIILREGDSVYVKMNGILCLTAFSDSEVYVRRVVRPLIKDFKRFIINQFQGILINIKNGKAEPV